MTRAPRLFVLALAFALAGCGTTAFKATGTFVLDHPLPPATVPTAQPIEPDATAVVTVPAPE